MIEYIDKASGHDHKSPDKIDRPNMVGSSCFIIELVDFSTFLF